MYFPDRANVPGLTRALDTKATISIKPQANDSMSVNGNVGVSVDLAFSPVNHFGIIGSYRWINDRVIKEDQTILINTKVMGGRFNGKRWELGAGYYDNIGATGLAEIYAGYGNGSLNRVGVRTPEYDYDTKYHRFFFQPSMGFKIGDYFRFAGGFRTSFVTFYDFQSPNNPNLRNEIGNYNYDVTSPVYVFFEPFLNFEGGYKYFKGNVQVGSASQINNAKIAGNFPVYVSVGMVFYFSPDFLKPSR
jgi:hypothetical protein